MEWLGWEFFVEGKVEGREIILCAFSLVHPYWAAEVHRPSRRTWREKGERQGHQLRR